ncbi:hypothetical protein [Nocardioides nematodiphilus]|uniref:hypothetical protein n=1 Tax=Nocardioides nematodiphilus TaxID=2849669 RepID=UPI001CD9DDE2|nr:hypothetical protein [Nocardioides nematodiphilus]MCA1984608.1 hypothetical protein [Nocardioides nematodiphilus]
MATLSPGMVEALHGLEQAIVPPRAGVPLGNWRWSVRQRLAGVREALVDENTSSDDGWLAARGGQAFRERGALIARLSLLSDSALTAPDPEVLRHDLRRLIGDIGRHVQRLNDLAYDDVEMEVGGES